jgi:hypothetical protein
MATKPQPRGGRRDNRKRRPDDQRGGKRPGAGPKKVFATVRLPIDAAPPLVDWLLAHQPPDGHPARHGWDFLTAGLWSEVVGAQQR